MRTVIRLLCLIFLITPISGFAQNQALNFSAQFEYDLKLNVDAAKRATYLKKTGEQPSSYEAAFTVLSGTVQVAAIVDQVKFNKDQYQINSSGNLIAGMSTALGGQRLIRESVGTITSAGLNTSVYQEKRGNTDLLLMRYDLPKKAVIFYKTTFKNQVGTTPYSGQLLDLLSVGYQFIGRSLPTSKSLSVSVTDGRSIKQYTLIRAEPWDFMIDGKKVRAIRFYKTTSKEDTANFEIWFSEDRNIPVRSVLGLNDQYGATIQVDLKKIPNF